MFLLSDDTSRGSYLGGQGSFLFGEHRPHHSDELIHGGNHGFPVAAKLSLLFLVLPRWFYHGVGSSLLGKGHGAFEPSYILHLSEKEPSCFRREALEGGQKLLCRRTVFSHLFLEGGFELPEVFLQEEAFPNVKFQGELIPSMGNTHRRLGQFLHSCGGEAGFGTPRGILRETVQRRILGLSDSLGRGKGKQEIEESLGEDITMLFCVREGDGKAAGNLGFGLGDAVFEFRDGSDQDFGRGGERRTGGIPNA